MKTSPILMVFVIATLLGCTHQSDRTVEPSAPSAKSADRVSLRALPKPPMQPPEVRIAHGRQTQRGRLFKGEWLLGEHLKSLGRVHPSWPRSPLRVHPGDRLYVTLGTAIPPRSVTVNALGSIPNPGLAVRHVRTLLDCWLEDFDSTPACALHKVSKHDLVLVVSIPEKFSARAVAINVSWSDPRAKRGIAVDWGTWLFTVTPHKLNADTKVP